MAYRQYIGSRYVPIFGRKGENTYEWDDISNRRYWAETGNWNAQVEYYQAEVRTFDDRIKANTQSITTINEDYWVTENRIARNSALNGGWNRV